MHAKITSTRRSWHVTHIHTPNAFKLQSTAIAGSLIKPRKRKQFFLRAKRNFTLPVRIQEHSQHNSEAEEWRHHSDKQMADDFFLQTRKPSVLQNHVFETKIFPLFPLFLSEHAHVVWQNLHRVPVICILFFDFVRFAIERKHFRNLLILFQHSNCFDL